jgi:nitrogen regulatory protein P-II 1
VRKIVAIIRPSKLDDVKRALGAWVTGLSVSEVKGYGRQKGHVELFRGGEHAIDTVPKLAVEVVVPDPLVPRVLHELERCSRSGRVGDGKIFVAPVEEAIRIRTGDRGEDAL